MVTDLVHSRERSSPLRLGGRYFWSGRALESELVSVVPGDRTMKMTPQPSIRGQTTRGLLTAGGHRAAAAP